MRAGREDRALKNIWSFGERNKFRVGISVYKRRPVAHAARQPSAVTQHTMSFLSISPRMSYVWLLVIFALCLSGCGQQMESSNTDSDLPAVRPTQLCPRLSLVIEQVREGRQLTTSTQGAWQIVHGVLAFGEGFRVFHEGASKPALEYLLAGGALTGWKLRPGDHGIVAVVEEGSTLGQGHPDQWLGYLSQCGSNGIPLDRRLIVGNQEATVGDLLSQAQADLRPGQEATWTLMALATYLTEDERWQSSGGDTWSLERVIAMELEADLAASACGGTHRLYGLATAVNRYHARHPHAASPLPGVWGQAEATITDCIERARRFQQPDGSFSTQYFERPGTSPDVFAKLGSSGHIFEFLAIALPKDRLTEPWVLRAADRLVRLLEQTADIDVECGGLYHATHGLLLYSNRLCPAT